MSALAAFPTLDDIGAAARRVAGRVHRTPVITSRSIDAELGASLFFKCENFQRTGSFKIRGATNAVRQLHAESAARGVATHSSGNHAAALASASRGRGIVAHVVMPRNSARVKLAAAARYGANVVLCNPTLEARERTLRDLVRETGATVIHPYNDLRVIAGQGTAALELLHDLSHLDVVITPVGGGGLTAGTAIVVRALSPGSRMVAAEPAGADDACRSHRERRLIPVENPKTIADGLRTSLGDKTFPMIRDLVDQIVTVEEESIVRAMRMIWERMKIVVEPSAAVPLAALLEKRLNVSGKQVGIVLSGGNVDLDRLLWNGPDA